MKNERLTPRSERQSWPGLCLLLLVSQLVYSQTPTIVAIPTLGGDTSTPYGLNALGQVVGSSYVAGNTVEHAFLFSRGSMVDLNSFDTSFSVGYDVNRAGQVAGFYTTPDGSDTRAFLFKDGAMLDIGTLGGPFGAALKINDAGIVVGNSLTADYKSHGFIYNQNQMFDLGTLGGNSSAVAIAGLNSLGSVAGEAALPNGQTHACLWKNGAIIDLGTLGGTYSTSWAINDSDWVTGYSYTAGNSQTHAFLYNGISLIDIGTFGGIYSAPYAINKLGQVAGDSYTSASANHGFFYSDGQMLDIGTLGEDYTSVYDMNNSGQIVGESMDALGQIKPILWEKGTMTALADLLPADSGWELYSAYKISDGGHIIGYGAFQGMGTWYMLSLNRSQNQPPVAVAGANQVVECSGTQTSVTLNATASSDPDGDPLRYEWFYQNQLLSTDAVVTLGFALGTYQITLKVTDPSNASAQDSVSIAVVDTASPTVAALAPVTLVANGQGQAAIPNFHASLMASDNCTPANLLSKAQIPAPGTVVGLGVTTVQITVADVSGNVSTGTATVTVEDRTAPVIQSLTANPVSLSSQNKLMVPVTLTVAATDNSGQTPVSRIVSVTSSEPVTGPGDKTSPDWQITGPLTVNLRAEGNGRVYTVTVQSTDAAGNSSTAALAVIVEKTKKGK